MKYIGEYITSLQSELLKCHYSTVKGGVIVTWHHTVYVRD